MRVDPMRGTVLVPCALCKCREGVPADVWCVTRTRQPESKLSNTQESKVHSPQERTTSRSSANLTKPSPTAMRYALVKDTIILHRPTPQAASSKSTPKAYTCGTNGKHEAPHELSAHRGIGIADVLHGESNRGNTSPRTTIPCM